MKYRTSSRSRRFRMSTKRFAPRAVVVDAVVVADPAPEPGEPSQLDFSEPSNSALMTVAL